MRILLVYPNAQKEIIGWGDLGAIAEPLALEYIGTGAKLDGHEVKILDLRLHPKDLDLHLLTYQPDVVGVTGYSMHVIRDLEICKRAKELQPDCITVAGGHHATLLPEDFFEPYMDYVAVGEGVKPFREMLAQIATHGVAQDIPGVWSRVEGAFRFGGPQPPFDINDLPVPDRTLVEADRASYYIDWMRPIALLRTTVGCPYRCSFCALWKIMDGRYYKRDVVRVVEELRTIPEHYVFFVDDEPFVNPPRMKELAACIKDAGIQKEYFAYCRIDSFLRDRELMQAWHEVGLRRVLFGIESIFEHELKDYNKRQKLEQIIEALQAARELGIHVFANFIIKPDYARADFEKVIDFIKRYNVEYPSFTILTPTPGTELSKTFDHVLEYQPNGRPNWAYFDMQHAVTETKLPRDEFMQAYWGLSTAVWPIKEASTDYRQSYAIYKKVQRGMKNRNLQIGSDFLQKSLYDSPSLQEGRQEWHPQEHIPLPFKVYQKTERYPLHQTPPLTLGDLRQAFHPQVDGGQPIPYGFESLSTLLYYTYGFSRHDEGAGVSWPFHRVVASARCFFPTELYLWLPQTEHIPAGVYHYDNLHHSLALIRAGEYRDLLATALDTELENCLGVLLISAHFWKTAFKYINFAYRLCTQEAGIVTGNALIVASTLGYTGRVHYQFLDQPLNRLLGFVPDEESLLAVVPLYAGNIQDRGTGASLGREEASPLSIPRYVDVPSLSRYWSVNDRFTTSSPDRGQPYPPLRSMEAHHTPPSRSTPMPPGPPALQRLGTKKTEQSLFEAIAPITLDYAKTTTFDRKLCPILTEMDQHTFLEDTTEIVTVHDAAPSTPCVTTEERIAPPAPSPAGIDLAEALHFRSSGDMNFHPLQVPLSLKAFWEIVRYSLTAYNSDLQYATSSPHLQLYIVVQSVEGIEAGIYRLCAECGMLHVIERGDFASRVQVLQMAPNVASAPANLVCFLAGDYAAQSQIFGNRAYRMLNLEAGLIAQRISLMSAALGLTVRYSNSYIQPLSKILLKLKETSIEPFAELVIGYEQPGVQAGGRQRFSLLR